MVPAVDLADGVYTAEAEQTGAGVGRSAAHTFRVDTVAPQPTLDAIADGDDATPTFTGTARRRGRRRHHRDGEGLRRRRRADQDLTATRTGTSFSVDATPALPPGTYTARAEQDDDLGNGPGVSATRTFTITRAAPGVTITAPAAGRGNDATPTFSGAAGDRPGDAATVVLTLERNGVPQQFEVARTGATWTFTPVTNLPDGTYTARARQSQTSGPEGVSAPRTFTIDTTGPALSLTAPPSATNDRTPRVAGTAGTASGDAATVTVRVYAGTAASGTPIRTFTVTRSGASFGVDVSPQLADGVYTARAEQSDDLGHGTLSSARTFTVDATAPAVTITTPANGATTALGGAVAFAGRAGTAAGDATAVTVRVFAGSGTGGSVVRTMNGTRSGSNWSASASPALPPGPYTVEAEQGDAAGNAGRSAARTFTVPAPVVDDVGEIEVPDSVKPKHLFCKRARRCKRLAGTARFNDRGKAVWKLTVTDKRNGRAKTATVTTLKQRIDSTGVKEFKLEAIGKQRLLKELKRARDVKMTLTLTFTDRDGNRTVRTMAVKLRL